VHEQGIANVNVLDGVVSVITTPVTDGGGGSGFVGTSFNEPVSPAVTASALSIHMTSRVSFIRFSYRAHTVATFLGPSSQGNSDIQLALTRPIRFDSVSCPAPNTSEHCSVSWVGAQ